MSPVSTPASTLSNIQNPNRKPIIICQLNVPPPLFFGSAVPCKLNNLPAKTSCIIFSLKIHAAPREITKEYLDEYVELFINYKLKVLQAKEMGLDREESFVSELEMYRKQLAKPYLQAKEFKEDLVNEAYERMRYDVSASHILFKLDENSTPSDTLLKYNIAKVINLKDWHVVQN